MFLKRRNKRRKKGYNYFEFMTLFQFCSIERQKELVAILEAQPRPMFLGGKRVPESLNGMSYGTLDDLHADVEMGNDPIVTCLKSVMGFTEEEIPLLPIEEVYGFRNFVIKELERINKLFAEITVNYSNEEIRAGVKDLNFGSFGVLDWYAKRMGITNQNEVRDVAWVRIYTCMYNDAMKNNYERKLNKQYTSKVKK